MAEEWRTQTDDHREAEGGCGVIGLASTAPIAGRHIIRSVGQMRNRGNGKGGGLALVGCFPEYPHHYALNIALLDPAARGAVERRYVEPYFDIAHVEVQPELDDHRAVGLEIRPPRTVRYFVRVKPDVLARHAETFRKRTDTSFKTEADVEDDFVYQNTFRLNVDLYGQREDKQAYVVSHGRNMLILKAVGYAEDIARFYRLEDVTAHVWIGHQRYPTRGRVWHPGGAHPFLGMDDALVHNGDFANFVSTSVYLKQRGYTPLFLTDTEVSVLAFDLYNRLYNYPLELIFEALAPTTERDFVKLPPEKQRIYKAIQTAHMHGSPDGPWFFIVARNGVIDARRGRPGGWQLVGITDTSMLRPQVFALQETDRASMAVIASEEQAINAVFESVAAEDARFCPVPDRVWVARGGSHSDGGAFVYRVLPSENGYTLECTDKFGRPIRTDRTQRHDDPAGAATPSPVFVSMNGRFDASLADGGVDDLFAEIVGRMPESTFAEIRATVGAVCARAADSPLHRRAAIDLLTRLRDRRYPTGGKKRSALLAILDDALRRCFRLAPLYGLGAETSGDVDRRIDFATRRAVRPPANEAAILYIDARAFPAEGDDSAARAIVRAHREGWKRIVVFHCKGDRFLGCGLGPRTYGLRIDVYGSSGDYLGSGLHGAEVHVHGDAQDQVGQILTEGKIVVHGNVGQTFLYGAKGGVCYILGNAAGRPLINAVGRVRAVINGTCLDYCAESFMAGAETGGGFVCINGLAYDERGRLARLNEPYPGGNFFSLASGGAGYVADPHGTMDESQLNGARYVDFAQADWEVLRPHLEENAWLFGLPVEAALNVDGRALAPEAVYRKVIPLRQVLSEKTLETALGT